MSEYYDDSVAIALSGYGFSVNNLIERKAWVQVGDG